MTYEVQQHTAAGGWNNNWYYADDFDRLQPETFATREEAEAALRQYLEELSAEKAAGQLAIVPNPWDFRVQYVFTTPLPLTIPTAQSQEINHD